MPNRRSIGLALLAVVTVAALAWGFRPPPVAVEIGLVTRAPLAVTVEEEGRTRVRDRFEVSAPVPGFVRRLTLDVGDPVTRGQVLAELEPLRSTVLDPRARAEAEARVASAEYALQAAEQHAAAAAAEASRAQNEFERRRKLCESGCISKEELDTAELLARRTVAERRSAEFAIEVARFELEAARTALSHSAAQPIETPLERVQVRAPVAGRVLRLVRRSEGVVAGGETLIEIGDPAALEVAVDVLSSDAVRIAPGTLVRLARWGGDADLLGQVRVVEPAGFTKVSALGVEEQRVWVIADITSPPERWQRLGDGYRVEASFVLWQGEDVLQVPAGALFRLGDGWAAFVVENDRAVRREVSIGHRNAEAVEVIGGLTAGERVVLHPSNRIDCGTRVRER
jgi:HlyD family secretion protein